MNGDEFKSAEAPESGTPEYKAYYKKHTRILPTSKGTSISIGTGTVAPLIVWLWNMNFPDQPITAEWAALLAGPVTYILGIFYNIIYSIFWKLDIDIERTPRGE